jgi:hypothetical protein
MVLETGWPDGVEAFAYISDSEILSLFGSRVNPDVLCPT